MGVDKQMEALGLSEKLRAEAEANQVLMQAATMPAIQRYTGVLFDALDAPTLTPEARERLCVGSALFGLLRADDAIPHYRLSAGSKLPGGTLKKRWGGLITEALMGLGEPILDLRSGAYQQLGKLNPKQAAVFTVRVETIQEDGTRKVVSHFNKHYKGELARAVALAGAESLEDVATVAREAGMTPEITSPDLLTLVVKR